MAFQTKKKPGANTEIDLVAFISLLSVCICFLLLTTVWIQIGSMNVKQAVGGQPASNTKPKPDLWVVYSKTGELQFNVKNVSRSVSRKYAKMPVPAVDGRPDLEALASILGDLKASVADLSMALIRPTKVTLFEDIISVMDTFRSEGFNDLGVTPL